MLLKPAACLFPFSSRPHKTIEQPSTSGAKRAYDATAHLPPAKRPALPPGPGHKPKAAGAAGGAAKRLLTIDVGSGVVGTSYGPSSPEELAAAARVLQQAHARALASRSVQHAARSHHHNVLGARRPHMLLSTGNKAPPSPSSGPHRLSLPLHTAAAATGISLTASLRHASDVAAAPSKPALLDLIDHVSDLDPHHLFLFPVTNAVAPDYYRVVRRPLDLTTLRARVMQGRYSTWAAFSDDVTTMIANALRYFAEGSECQRIASDLLPKAKELLATASASAAAAAADDGGDPRDSAAAAAVIAPAPLKSLTSEEGAAAAALAAMAAGSGCSPIGAHARPAFGAALDSIVALAPNGGPTAGAAAAATAAVAVPGGGGSSGGAVSLTPPSLSPVSSLAAPLGAVAAVAAAPATPPPPLQQRNSGPVVSVPLTSLVVTANGALKMQLPPGVLGAPARPNGSPVTAAAAVAGAQTVTTGLSPHAPRTVVPVQASPVPSLPPALAAVAPLPSAVASIVGSIPPGGPGSALPPLIHFTAGAEEGATSSSGPAMTRAGTAAAAAARKELCVLTEELLAEPGSKLAAIVEAATAANPARRMPHLATANVELLESFVLMHLRCVEQHADSDFLGILPDDANQLGRLSAEAQALRLPRLAARVSQKVAALGSGA